MAEFASAPDENNRISIGKHVLVDLVLAGGETERLEFDIVPDESADFTRGFLGTGTPLAKAITGLQPGQKHPYRVDDVCDVIVVSISPSKSAPPSGVKQRREEVIRKAVDHSDRTNAIIFASSFSGKWGDYDPTGFEDEDQHK